MVHEALAKFDKKLAMKERYDTSSAENGSLLWSAGTSRTSPRSLRSRSAKLQDYREPTS